MNVLHTLSKWFLPGTFKHSFQSDSNYQGEMARDRFAVLEGTGVCKVDESVLIYFVEGHRRLKQYQVRVKSFLKYINYRDVGMPKEYDELILMRFISDSIVPEVVVRMEGGFTFNLRKIPETVLRSCEAQLDLEKLDSIPNLASDISLLIDKTGIDIYKDQKTGALWVHGEWFQVALAKSYLVERYASLFNVHELKCCTLAPEQVNMLQEWVNMDPFVSIGEEDLPVCVFAVCKNIRYINQKDDVIFEKDKTRGNIIFRLKSVPSGPFYRYEDLKQQYHVMELTRDLPIDYWKLLTEMIELKFQPNMVLTSSKQRKTFFLFLREKMQLVNDFIENFKNYCIPSSNCGIQFMNDTAMERRKNPVERLCSEQSARATTEPDVSETQTSGSSSPVKTEKSVFTIQDALHMRYLYMNYMDEFQSTAKYHSGTVTYTADSNGGQLEIQATDPKNQNTILQYIKETYQEICIVTKSVPVKQLQRLSGNKEAVHVSLSKDISTVQVTGPAAVVSHLKMEEPSDGSSVDKEESTPPLEAISENPAAKAPKRRRDRKLVLNGGSDVGRSDIQEESTDTGEPELLSAPKSKPPSCTESGPVIVYQAVKTGTLIEAGVGDITKLDVSAIVNAANKDLKHVGGVARAISVAAGPGFDKVCQAYAKNNSLATGDVCVTGPGALPCEMVIHAVGPIRSDFSDAEECFHTLQRTFYRCLRKASQKHCVSIAIPAISAGVYGVDPDVVAHRLTESIREFLDNYPKSPLRSIRLIDISKDIVDKFNEHLMRLVQTGTLTKMARGATSV